jgi:alpha-1,6-mannosyltransferase
MKICDLTQSYTASSGGVRTYIEAKKKFIQKKTNHSHLLIVPGAADQTLQTGRSVVYEIKAPRIPGCAPYRFILNLFKVYSILKAEKPDVIELGSGYILPWVAFIYRFRHECAVISFYHTDYPTAYLRPVVTRFFGHRAGIFAEKLGQQYVRLVYKKFKVTLTASQRLKEKLDWLKISQVHYLPLGVETRIFHPGKRNSSLRQKLGLTRQNILLLYVGRLDPEKRVHIILEAFRQIPAPHPFHLLCIGDGPLKNQLIENTSSNPRIKILPYENNRKKLSEFFASADIYITAGPHETFGLCVLEAQSSGLPVIGVRAGALLERVPETVGLLGSVDSPSEMTQNILKLSQLNYRKLGRNARWFTEQNYSWDQIFAHLLQLYEQQCSTEKNKQPMFLPYTFCFNNPKIEFHLTSEANRHGNRNEKFPLRDQL